MKFKTFNNFLITLFLSFYNKFVRSERIAYLSNLSKNKAIIKDFP